MRSERKELWACLLVSTALASILVAFQFLISAQTHPTVSSAEELRVLAQIDQKIKADQLPKFGLNPDYSNMAISTGGISLTIKLGLSRTSSDPLSARHVGAPNAR